MLGKRPYLAALLLLAIGLVFGATLVSGFGSWKGMNIAFGASDIPLGGALPELPNDPALAGINGSFVAISKAVQPTIVQIDVKTEAPKLAKNDKNDQFKQFQHFFNFGDGNGDQGGGDGGDNPFFQFQPPQQGPEEGIGSGVIVTSDGYILTNNHVVKDAAKKGGIKVQMTDKRVFDAQLIGTDPTTDLAVIKVDATGLPVAALGNSDEIQVGQIVFAVGNPMGLESTVTEGIISSTGRYVDIFDQSATRGKDGSKYAISNFIQTDAAINPGNSGGGLFNIRGEVVGINAAIASQTGTWMGYGFAIPINMAKSVVTDLIKSGKVNRGYIGVSIGPVDQTLADAIGLDRPHGVLIDKVQPGQAGDLAGLKSQDVILSVDGRNVDASNQLQSMIGMHHAGDKVMLHIWRDGKEFDKSVTLKERADIDDKASDLKDEDEEKPAETSTKSTATLDNIGLTVRTVTDDEKDKFHVSNGVMITNEAMASEAMDRGIPRAKAVITEAAHHKVKSAGDFEDIINANKGKAVGLTIVDDKGDSHFFAIRVPKD
jgi:serine protease Do